MRAYSSPHSNRWFYILVLALIVLSTVFGVTPRVARGQSETPPPPPQIAPGDQGAMAALCTAPGKPPVPGLVTPANGSTVIITNPLLDWTGTTAYCINYYNIQVWVDGGSMLLSAWPSVSQFTVPAGTLTWGVKYNWYVWGHSNSKGFGNPMVASFSTTPVSNDDFGFPTAITAPPYTITEATTSATTSSDDPTLPAACGAGQGTKSVWWSFTPNSTGTLDVNTAGSSYDTLLAIWTGTRDHLVPVPFGCNDNVSPGDTTSSISALTMIPGNPYYIEVVQSGGGDTGGSLNLSVVFNSLAQSVSFTSEPAYDGWVLETGDGANKGGTLNSTSETMIVGNTPNGRIYHSFLSFVTTLPAAAVIISAVVTLRKSSISNPSPFDLYPALVVDIRKGNFGSSPNLVLSDWQATPSLKTAGTIIKPPSPSGPYSASLLPAAFTYINRAGRTQFKVRFTGDDFENGFANIVNFYTGNTTTPSYRPALVVTYYTP